MHTVPSFPLHCYLSLPPPPPRLLSPSIPIAKGLFLPLVLFGFLTAILLSSVSPSVSLFVLLPFSRCEVREGASVPGEMLFVLGGTGEGPRRIRGEGIRSGKGMKGRMRGSVK